jgi:hypothetical protein
MTAANKAALKAIIAGITIGDDKGNNPAFSKSLWRLISCSRAAPRTRERLA